MSKLAFVSIVPVIIFSGLLEAAYELETMKSSGEASWQRLDRYQDGEFLGNFTDHFNSDDNSHCFLVDKNDDQRIIYAFSQSAAYISAQLVFTPSEKIRMESSLPAFSVTNPGCDSIGNGYTAENFIKFDSFEDYKFYAQEDINAVSAELKALANEAGVGRFSTLYSVSTSPTDLRF